MSEDTDISDLPTPNTDISDLPVPPQSSSWLDAAKGVGQAGLALGAGGLKAINLAANDILPGEEDRAAMRKRIEADPILNYQGGPEAQPIMSTLADLTRPIAKMGSAVHQGISDLTSPRTADVVGDIATLAPGARGAFSKLEPGAAIEKGHPLTQAAQAESGRLTDIKTRAEQAGYDLPEGGAADRHANASINNRPLVNAGSRTELNLPKNAPLTPQMLAKGREVNGSPGYQAVENIKEDMPLNRAALDEARTANMNGTPNERLPFPQGDTITGSQAVDFSKKARYLANQLEKNPANPFAREDAQMYRDAAEAVEGSVRDHLKATGRPRIASGWDDARTYYAKSYSVEGALDGAGNVRAADLKNQLFRKGKPLSGGLEDIANLAAQYPEAFKTSRVTMPQTSLLRRGAAALAPAAGAALGSFVGGGTGAGLGTQAGQHIAEKIINP